MIIESTFLSENDLMRKFSKSPRRYSFVLATLTPFEISPHRGVDDDSR
jgi:hypothetical protein